MSDLSNVTVIKPPTGFIPVDTRELLRYRELFYFLARRDISVRYKQTILGGLWAVIQPAFSMIVFSLFFGRMAGMPSDGVPYPVFVYAGLLAWTYFSNAVSSAGESMISNSRLLTKVYFPRLIIPLSSALAGLMDLLVASSLLCVLLPYYGIMPGPQALLFPALILLVFLCAAGAGLWLSALNVQYRDIRYVIPFLMQLWLFLSPVIYPAGIVPAKYRWLAALNPMTGIINAFRSCLVGTPMDWPGLGTSAAVTVLLLLSGVYYFRRMEREFSDII